MQQVSQSLLGLGLDLADTLAGDTQALPDFLERPNLSVLESEPKPDHHRFTS